MRVHFHQLTEPIALLFDDRRFVRHRVTHLPQSKAQPTRPRLLQPALHCRVPARYTPL